MRKLYRFEWDCGTMGEVEGLFAEDEAEVQKFIGLDVCFGYILGKRFEVDGTLAEEDLEVISEDQDKIDWLVGITSSTVSGFNPLDYIKVYCDRCGDPIFENRKWLEYKVVDYEKLCESCSEEL